MTMYYTFSVDFERPALLTVSMCASSSLSQAEVERANDGVSRHMSEKYSTATYDLVHKYAAENGPTRAAR